MCVKNAARCGDIQAQHMAGRTAGEMPRRDGKAFGETACMEREGKQTERTKPAPCGKIHDRRREC